VAAFRRVVKALAHAQRYHLGVPLAVLQAVETLPVGLRDILIARYLLAPSTGIRVPTVNRLLGYYERVEPETDKRVFAYIREYFGGDTPVDTITPSLASGLRHYLTVERTTGRGRLAGATVDRAVAGATAVFRFAVEFGYLVRSPMDWVEVKTIPDKNPA
jgi:hypothetical protein